MLVSQRASISIQGCLILNLNSTFNFIAKNPTFSFTLADPSHTLGQENRERLSSPPQLGGGRMLINSQLRVEWVPEPISLSQVRDYHWQDNTEIFLLPFLSAFSFSIQIGAHSGADKQVIITASQRHPWCNASAQGTLSYLQTFLPRP